MLHPGVLKTDVNLEVAVPTDAHMTATPGQFWPVIVGDSMKGPFGMEYWSTGASSTG